MDWRITVPHPPLLAAVTAAKSRLQSSGGDRSMQPLHRFHLAVVPVAPSEEIFGSVCVWLTLERTRPGPGHRTGHSKKVGACLRDPDHESRDTRGGVLRKHTVAHAMHDMHAKRLTWI